MDPTREKELMDRLSAMQRRLDRMPKSKPFTDLGVDFFKGMLSLVVLLFFGACFLAALNGGQ